jgi:hypothetical protein
MSGCPYPPVLDAILSDLNHSMATYAAQQDLESSAALLDKWFRLCDGRSKGSLTILEVFEVSCLHVLEMHRAP